MGKVTETFKPGFVPFFRNKFQGLFQDSNFKAFSRTQIDFSMTPNFLLIPFIPKISNSILLKVFIYVLKRKIWKLYCLSSVDFHEFQGPVVFFHDFLVLEDIKIKCQGFPRFPIPMRALLNTSSQFVYHERLRYVGGLAWVRNLSFPPCCKCWVEMKHKCT